MYPPTPKGRLCVLESTYGDLHPESDPKLELEMYINNTFKMGGTVFIPSFAERAQMIMYLLWQREEGKTLTFLHYGFAYVSALMFFLKRKWHKLSLEDCMINKMFTITDYKETIDTIYNKALKW
jgi:metallo-beta-lactamase family protein